MMSEYRVSLGEDVLQGLETVVEALREVSVSLDMEETLQSILNTLHSLIPFDAAGIYTVNPETRELEHHVERGYELSKDPSMALIKGQSVIRRVFAGGHSLTQDVAEEPKYIEKRQSTRTEMAVPIVGSGGRILGAINMESDRQDSYAPLSLGLLELLATAVGGAIERTSLHTEIVDKRRLEHEISMARGVMSALLPRSVPQLPGFEVAAVLTPSHEVGGDYYDFISIDRHRWAVVTADVAGKGIPAALLVSALKASLFSLARNELALRSIVNKLNSFFEEVSPAGRYATLFYVEVDVPTRHLIYINAGHLPAMLIRADGRTELLQTGGMPVGLFPETRFIEGFAEMRTGDVLALYTDGIIEACSPKGEEYGVERLQEILVRNRECTAPRIVEVVMNDQEQFSSGRARDDRTLLVMRAQ